VSAAREALARSLRALLDGLGATGAPDAELAALTAQIDAASERFARTRRERPASAALAGMGDFAERGPICGRANPIAPPAELAPDRSAQTVRGSVTFGDAFEGAPGIVHGGFVAAVLDEALGMVAALPGTPAMTGELKVRFKRPTPTRTRLEIRAQVDEARGRRVLVSGELLAGGLVTAAATGLFVAVGSAKFDELDGIRRERQPAG